MNDPATWSDRPLPLPPGYEYEGRDDNRRIVPLVLPPDQFFDDPPEDAPQPDASDIDQTQLLRNFFDFLETGEPHLMAARLQALRIIHRIGGLSIRDAAAKAGCSRTTLHRITRRVGHFLQR